MIVSEVFKMIVSKMFRLLYSFVLGITSADETVRERAAHRQTSRPNAFLSYVTLIIV